MWIGGNRQEKYSTSRLPKWVKEKIEADNTLIVSQGNTIEQLRKRISELEEEIDREEDRRWCDERERDEKDIL